MEENPLSWPSVTFSIPANKNMPCGIKDLQINYN